MNLPAEEYGALLVRLRADLALLESSTMGTVPTPRSIAATVHASSLVALLNDPDVEAQLVRAYRKKLEDVR